MQKKLPLMVLAVCCSTFASAQSNQTQQTARSLDENAFTFTEAQLGEDDNMSQNVTILNSTTNAYANEVGFLFSPMRFRYRAFNQKYNEIFINVNPAKRNVSLLQNEMWFFCAKRNVLK